jgi:hypothetical protein
MRRLKEDMWTVLEQGIWSKRTNEELRELHKDLDTAAEIKKERLEWLGHVVRMHHEMIVKKIFESKLEGRRKMGRSRLRQLEDVEKDLREMKT